MDCTRLSTVHVSVVYFDYLCGYRYMFCQFVYLIVRVTRTVKPVDRCD